MRLSPTFTLPLLAASLLLAGVPSSRAQTASVTGAVSLASVSKQRVTTPRYRGLTVKPGKPDAATAVVYLEGVKATGEAPSVSAAVVQKELQFRPALLPVRVGTKVTFPNSDALYHNVFSYSRTKRFDLGRYLKGEAPPTVVFDKAGEVKLFCEIHSHMRASILVLDTPHFVKTDAAGNYRLENLPAGSYTLKAWLNSRTIYESPVELKDGAETRVDFAG